MSRVCSLPALLLCAASPLLAWSADEQAGGLKRPAPDEFPELFAFTDTCNTYVLRSGDKALLLNIGAGGAVERLEKIGIKQIEWILFTDHHRENCQALTNAEIDEAKIAAPAAERELFEKPTQFRKWFPKLGDQYSVYGASYVRPPRTPIAIDKAFADGEQLKWRGFEITCLATPGHSPGGMSYLIQRGDKTFAFIGGLMHDGAKMTNWYDSEWDYGFAKGVDQSMASVDRLIEADIDIAFASQGPIIPSADRQLRRYREKLTAFREDYVRGYPVFDKTIEKRDPISKTTKVRHINQVTPHLYKLSHETQGKNFAIIVSDEGRGLILDCGLFPKDMLDEIILGMREHLGLKGIDAFWISHMHGDHFLLGPTLKEKYGAEAWTLDRIADRCENPRRYDYAALVSAYGDGFDGMKIEKKFRDGETVKWQGYTIQVDWMPGQTEFGCCLWLEIDGKRIAFTGDNLFGSPADESQNGHEAVVARNSAILEEGYVRGSKYLLELKPDIVMGSHSYVMPEPHKFLRRYHAWSKRMVTLYEDLLPDADYEYHFDPYWVSAYPYRLDFSTAKALTANITVRNFRDRKQRYRITPKTPAGVKISPTVFTGELPPHSERTFPVLVEVDHKKAPKGISIVPFDITLDDKRYGELFDLIIRTSR